MQPARADAPSSYRAHEATGPRIADPSGYGGRWRWKWAYRLLVAATSAATVVGLLLLALVAASPSVSTAPSRVQAILDGHHAPSDGGALPARVATALLATEDSRFYSDPALDPRGVVRATWGVLTNNGNDGGATIELQLAKMLYVQGTSPGSELRQVGVAFRLDQRFSKQQILAMYLDAAYFGDGAYGVVSASRHYFGVDPDQLSWAQASLLAGLVQAPSNYDPHGHLGLARQRQAHVLARLVATGHLTSRQAAAVWNEPLDPAVTFYG